MAIVWDKEAMRMLWCGRRKEDPTAYCAPPLVPHTERPDRDQTASIVRSAVAACIFVVAIMTNHATIQRLEQIKATEAQMKT